MGEAKYCSMLPRLLLAGDINPLAVISVLACEAAVSASMGIPP